MNLLEAAGMGDVLRVELLLSEGASVEVKRNQDQTPLNISASSGHFDVVRFLVEHGAVVDAHNRCENTPLMSAASGGHLDVVQYLVERGAAINTCDNDGRTTLMWAAGGGHLNVVQYLVELGAAVNSSDNYGLTSLMRAAENSHLDVVKYLVKCGAALDTKGRDGRTLLMRVAENGHLDVVQYFVECGVTVNTSDSDGREMLIRTASWNHFDVVRFFLEREAVVNASDIDGWRLLMWATQYGHLDVVQLLVERGAVVQAHNKRGETPLMSAAFYGHLDIVQYLFKRGAGVNTVDNVCWKSLMRAAGRGHLDVVQYLVECGSDVGASNTRGETALMNAAGCGRLDVVQFLVERGAVVDAHANSGSTSLMRAASGGHFDVVQFLVARGADVNVHTNNGETSLMRAAEYGYLKVVQYLVEHGAVVDTHSNGGETPIMLAAGDGHLDVVQYLVEHGAVVNVYNRDGNTPLMAAANGGHLDVVKYLVDQGAVTNTVDNDGWTSLMRAAGGGHLDVVQYLVEREAFVDARNNCGETPLMCAAGGGHINVVQYLVEHGANSNLVSAVGNTALLSASKFGRQDVVRFLLPLVQHHGRRNQTVHIKEHSGSHANIPSSWLIPHYEVEVEPYIDAGNIGGDYRGKWLDADVVVKLFVDGTTSTTFVDEVRLWHQLRHPNVLKLYGVCNVIHHLFVCEYASKGSLPEYLKECDAELRTPWKFLYEAALGLEYLHERNIVHGNLRGNNILIGSDGLAKLSGFTKNAPSSEGWYSSGDWVRWASPESLKGEQISLASDVYSLGICIIEAVSGKVPFYEFTESQVKKSKNMFPCSYMKFKWNDQDTKLTNAQEEFVLVMCSDDSRDRVQISAVVNKLEAFERLEATAVTQLTEPESLVAYDEFNYGYLSSLWEQVQTFVAQSKDSVYRQIYHDLEMIYNVLKADSHPKSTLDRFYGILNECQLALDSVPQQNRVYRLSATRARDHSIQSLHRRITQLLQLVRPQNHDTETRENEWKRLCREQVAVFVSEASEACVMLSSVNSEEDRSALIAVLRAELRNSDRKYTEKQVSVLRKTHDDIVAMSLEDVHLATTPEWFIPWFELEMNEMTMLGEGGFGSVIKAKWLDSEVVVKKLEIADKDTANDDKKREMRQMFEREVDIWFGLSHPHVVRLFGACHVGRPFFVCELAPNGTLDEYLRRHPDEIWVKLREAALGVQYLHARGIVHGDLKCNNILIGSDGKSKVTDFGLSDMFGDDSTEVMLSGAWHWVAPECLLGDKPTFASDIYSLGMCIIEALRVINGAKYPLPWGELPNVLVKHHVTRNSLPLQPKNCSDEGWMLIEHMCRSAPTDRMLIMTVVDEIEKLVVRQRDLGGERDQTVGDSVKMQLSSSSVTDEIAGMKSWLAKCNLEQNWEVNVLTSIYQLLWDRFAQVAALSFPDNDVTVVDKRTNSDLKLLIKHSRVRTRTALDITGVIPLIKFTELSLGGYALHRRLDKFMAAHAFPKDSSILHDWTSACNKFMGVSNCPALGCNKEDCSVDEVPGDYTRTTSF